MLKVRVELHVPDAVLRKTAARTVDAVWFAIGALLDQFEPNECSTHEAFGL